MSGEFLNAPGDGDEMLRHINDVLQTLGGTGIAPGFDHVADAPVSEAADAPVEAEFSAFERLYGMDVVLGSSEAARANLQALETAMAAGAWPRWLPGYVAEGSISAVFRIDVAGRDLVAKMPFLQKEDPEQDLLWMLRAFSRGKDVSGLAQMVSFSRTDPRALFVENIEGDSLNIVAARERLGLSSFRGLLQTYKEMQLRGLAADNNSSTNTKVTADGKLVVADYDYDPSQELIEKVVEFGSREVLLGDRDGELSGHVPEYALLYREACYEELGPEYADALTHLWQSYGLFVPPLQTGR